MNIDDLKTQNLVIYECISGSKAYGLDTPSSDTDIKGVFVLPKKMFYSLHYEPQISDSSNDKVYYEIGRYIELLIANNPNILELAATPNQYVLTQSEALEKIRVEDFLSKLCAQTFGGYAFSQLKRAQGLNKKIVNPMEGPRKTLLDFCYVSVNKNSAPLNEFLSTKGWEQEKCGLAKINNMKNIYGLYYRSSNNYKGIIKHKTSNELLLSSIDKDASQEALMFFNSESYSRYCKEYTEYQNWVQNRNKDRYETTLHHGKKYDAKNLMHTFRLLDVGIEIAQTGTVNVSRPDRKFLLNIKSGQYEYDELVHMAEDRLKILNESFAQSSLPDKPNAEKANKLLLDLREEFYKNKLLQ